MAKAVSTSQRLSQTRQGNAPLAALLGPHILHPLRVALVLLLPQLLRRVRVAFDAHLARFDARLERLHLVLALLGPLADLNELILLLFAHGRCFVDREALQQ